MKPEEIDKITEELFDWKSTPEEDRELYEEHRRRLEDEENHTMLYDPAEKDTRTYADCKKKYGKDIADKMLDAKENNNGHLDKGDYSELMKLHHRRKKKTTHASESAITRAPFVMLDYGIIKNPKVRKVLKKSMMLYLNLRAYIVREKFAGDHLKLHERFFKKGKLAASISTRKLAQDFEIDEKTVTAYLREMAKHKVIEIEKILAADSYDKQVHNVYVLGRHDSWKKETYLIEDLVKNGGIL